MKNFWKKHNKGLSLVELIVAIAIMSILGVAIGSFIMVSQRNYNVNSTETDLQYEAQLLANQLQDMIIDVNRGITYNYNEDAADASVPRGNILSDADMVEGDLFTKNLYVYNNEGYYLIHWDSETQKITFSKYKPTVDKELDGEGGVLLAENVSGFKVDLTKVLTDRTVSYVINLEKGTRAYTSTHKIKLRNEIQVNISDDIYEPDEDPDPMEASVPARVEVYPKLTYVWPGEDFAGFGDGIYAMVFDKDGNYMPEANRLIKWAEIPAESNDQGHADSKLVWDPIVSLHVSEDEASDEIFVYAELDPYDDSEHPEKSYPRLSSYYVYDTDNATVTSTTPAQTLGVRVRRIENLYACVDIAATSALADDAIFYSHDQSVNPITIDEGTENITVQYIGASGKNLMEYVGGEWHDMEVMLTDAAVDARDWSRAAAIIANIGGLNTVKISESVDGGTTYQQVGAEGTLVSGVTVNAATGTVKFNLKPDLSIHPEDYENYYVKVEMSGVKSRFPSLTKIIRPRIKSHDPIVDPTDDWERMGLLEVNVDALASYMMSSPAKDVNIIAYPGTGTSDENWRTLAGYTPSPITIRPTAGAEKITIGGVDYYGVNNDTFVTLFTQQIDDNAPLSTYKDFKFYLRLENRTEMPHGGYLPTRDYNGDISDANAVKLEFYTGKNWSTDKVETDYLSIDKVKVAYSTTGGASFGSGLVSESKPINITTGTKECKVYYQFTDGWSNDNTEYNFLYDNSPSNNINMDYSWNNKYDLADAFASSMYNSRDKVWSAFYYDYEDHLNKAKTAYNGDRFAKYTVGRQYTIEPGSDDKGRYLKFKFSEKFIKDNDGSVLRVTHEGNPVLGADATLLYDATRLNRANQMTDTQYCYFTFTANNVLKDELEGTYKPGNFTVPSSLYCGLVPDDNESYPQIYPINATERYVVQRVFDIWSWQYEYRLFYQVKKGKNWSYSWTWKNKWGDRMTDYLIYDKSSQKYGPSNDSTDTPPST